MLAIAIVPSVALLLAGVALAGYLVVQAVNAREFATKVHDSAEPGALFFGAVRAERVLTLRTLASNGAPGADLIQARAKLDTTAARMATVLQDMVDDAPDSVRQSIAKTSANFAQLPELRQRVDSRQASPLEAYAFYNRIIDEFATGLNGVAEGAPDAQTAFLRVTAMPLFTAADAMSRGDALAAAGIAGRGLSEEEFRTYISQVGAYHAELEVAAPQMIPSVRAKYEALLASPAWDTLSIVENAFLRGNQDSLPVPEAQWRDAATQVGNALMGLYIEQSSNATNVGLESGDRTLVTSIIAGAAALIVSFAVFFFAWRLSNRLIQRLGRLREETLEAAETQLPQLVERVRTGEAVDLDTEVALLDHGDDEIGQVADAFNKAQQTAIAAAVDEAKTREGTKKVFLNIAHRSQVLVHRQLKALDEAERKQEDPDQLDMLFRLDHLSTRARRNAENLIILGGERPGRQWRNPVALADLIRGATGETEDYARVTVGKLPNVAVAGPVVADLVHLLAELLDNATSFSPPNSRVEVFGDVVGKGVVIEIEDQGLGIEPEQAEELNAMLREPPDFSVMALSAEPRLGLFVVARLASRHGISVTLRESAYGGTRAIVLVRSELLAPVPQPEDGQQPEEALVPAQSVPSHRWPEEADTAPEPAGTNGHREEPPARVDLFRANVPAAPPEPPPAPPQQPAPSQHSALQQHQAPPQRPQVPLRAPLDSRPPLDTRVPIDTRPPQSRPPQHAGPISPDRPPLPRRRRQQNLAPQLRKDEETTTFSAATDHSTVPSDSPEQARSRLSAFQQGTRRAREQDPSTTDILGEHT
ncbi:MULTISPECIES: sensor histidine kinase [Amycolatopsis]|uniref:histidine kinase n=2 Tax=Amycolatopsis TaxID=1813 RepID=A0ABP7IMG6_9PSEU|nr:nitrate- and nitrite sensing domain-containing protein [Amycolatopsis tucumanensis]MCF6422842.1 nitrate- and nitrite sensing domain-containing protein [Amycolatopsis tucumanensis]